VIVCIKELLDFYFLLSFLICTSYVHWTDGLYVTGSSPGQAPLHLGIRQPTCTCMALSSNSVGQKAVTMCLGRHCRSGIGTDCLRVIQ